MAKRLEIFRKEFLQANSWSQRKDDVPVDLLDNLPVEELKIAEQELIDALSLRDSWPFRGPSRLMTSAAALQRAAHSRSSWIQRTMLFTSSSRRQAVAHCHQRVAQLRQASIQAWYCCGDIRIL